MIRRIRLLQLFALAGILLFGAATAATATGLGLLWPAVVPPNPGIAAVPTVARQPPVVLIISHEGGRRIPIAQIALRRGADALEIDVVAHHGALYVSHHPLDDDAVPTVPTAQQVWPVDATAHVVELDLKQSSPVFQRVLVSFLAAHSGPGSPQIFVSSRSVANLRAVKTGASNVFRFLSIGTINEWIELQSDPATIALINGVSIDHHLLTQANVAWLHQRGLLVYVWTVDDPERAQTFVQWGVDAITTNQSGIVTMLEQRERGVPQQLERIVRQA